MNNERMADAEPGVHETRDPGHHAHHGWMMIACCIPMLAIAVALVLTETASASAMVGAVACIAMMLLMMRGMNHGGTV